MRGPRVNCQGLIEEIESSRILNSRGYIFLSQADRSWDAVVYREPARQIEADWSVKLLSF